MKKLILLILLISTFSLNVNAQTDSLIITEIITPIDTFINHMPFYPSLEIKNVGTSTIMNPVLYIYRNGFIEYYTPINGPILPNESITFTETNFKFLASAVDFDICFIIDYLGKSDTACKTVLINPGYDDVGMNSNVFPQTSFEIGDVFYPTVLIKNYGLNPQSVIPVEYQYNNRPPVQEVCVCSNSLNYGDSIYYTFSTPFTTIYTNSFVVCFSTKMPGDIITFNDQGCMRMYLGLENNKLNSFTLSQNYPNPASNSTTISYLSKAVGEATFTVRDIQGKLVYQSSEKAQIGENSIILNTEKYSSGVYYYSLQLDNEIQTKSFMIKD